MTREAPKFAPDEAIAHSMARISRRSVLGGLALAVIGGTVPSLLHAAPASAWGGYSNGNIPLSAMVNVQYPGVSYWSWSSDPAHGAVGGVYLEAGAAGALVSLLTAYHNSNGGYLPVNEGYRSYAGQVYWANNGSGTAPGTSNHGWGRAVDFEWGHDATSQAQYNWVRANCGTYGYEPLGGGFGEFDYIHFNYTGAYAPPPSGGNSMQIIGLAGHAAYAISPGFIIHLKNMEVLIVMKTMLGIGSYPDLNSTQFFNALKGYGLGNITLTSQLPVNGAVVTAPWY